MKLELKHLAPYLPYKLKMCVPVIGVGYSKPYNRINKVGTKQIDWLLTSERNKPILRPLSDFTKEIEFNGKLFVPANKMLNQFSVKYKFNNNGMLTTFQSLDDNILLFINNKIAPECHFGIYTLLLKWHFDIFGLIEKGLAIDINTL